MCRWLAARFGVANVDFYRGDAGVWLPPGATHIYSFNRTFPPDALAAVARRLNAYPTWRYMVSSQSARAWKALGLRGVHDVHIHTGLHMAGSGSQHAMFVVARSAKVPRKKRAAAAAAAAHEDIDDVSGEAAGDDGNGTAMLLPPPRVRRRLL